MNALMVNVIIEVLKRQGMSEEEVAKLIKKEGEEALKFAGKI